MGGLQPVVALTNHLPMPSSSSPSPPTHTRLPMPEALCQSPSVPRRASHRQATNLLHQWPALGAKGAQTAMDQIAGQHLPQTTHLGSALGSRSLREDVSVLLEDLSLLRREVGEGAWGGGEDLNDGMISMG